MHARYVSLILVIDVKPEMTTAWIQRLHGARGRRLFALSLGFAVPFVLYFGLLTGSARAGTDVPSSPAEVLGAGDSADPSGALAGDPAGSTGQQASTAQTAASSAAATQQQPRNIVISVRVDSPGDDGEITQTNVVTVVSDGSNESSTTQAGDSEATGEQAATGQSATSAATATQNQAGNIVVSVRINSPGNNGSITQTNAALAGSNAANTSATTQGAPIQAAGDATEARATGEPDAAPRDPPVPIGPPVEQQPETPASSAPAGTPSRLVALPTPAGPRTARSPAHPARTRAAASGSAPSSAPHVTDSTRAAAAAGSQGAPRGWSNPPAAAPRPELHHPKPARRSAPAHRGIRESAADLLGSLAPRRALPVGESSKDVSSAALLTLIAVLCAALVFAGSAYLPSGRRLLDPRNWWRG